MAMLNKDLREKRIQLIVLTVFILVAVVGLN